MKETEVSALAYIHPDAQIGEGVTIEPFATIKGDTEIGDGSWIGSNAVIQEGSRIGRNVKIFPGAVISSIPQDLKYKGEYTTVEIHDNAIIREFATINRGTSYADKTVIGQGVLIMAYAHVAHDCILGPKSIIANTVNIAGHVEIDECAVVGGSSAIHQFVKIGKHAMVGGGSLIRKDIPPFITVAREPLTYAGVNYRGLQRRGFSPEQIRRIQEIYRVIFLSGMNNSQALDHVEKHFPDSDERKLILNFIRDSRRGIVRGYSFMNGKH